MIGNLFVRNFKSIREMDFPCKKVNIFIGEPNTGKSNILESIGVLSGAGFIRIASLNGFVRMQSMVDWFHNKSPRNGIRIGFTEATPQDDLGLGITFIDGRFRFTLETHASGAITYEVNTDGSWQGGSQMLPLQKFKFYRFQQFAQFTLNPSDFLVPPAGQNLLAVLLTNESLQQVVGELCANADLKLILKEAEGQIELQKEFHNNIAVAFPLRFTSETLQRVIFILAAIYSNQNSVITLEEPEAHAFPYHTKSLAETIGLDKRGNQYFIATHNPYFLTSILEKTPKHDIAVGITKFMNNETKVTQLSSEQLAILLEAGSDVFFNLESLLHK